MLDDGNSIVVLPQPAGSQAPRGTQENPVELDEAPAEGIPASTESDAGGAANDENGEGDASLAEEEGSFRSTDRFKTWRKHTRDLYQLMLHVETHWPSSCCQLLPYMKAPTGADADIMEQTLVCGTRTGGAEQNYLQLATLSLPTDTRRLDDLNFDVAFGEIGGFDCGPKAAGVKIESRYYHDGDVLTARYMCSNPRIIATASSNGSCYVFDPSQISKMLPPNKDPRKLVPLFPGDVDPDMLPEHRAKIGKQRYEFFKALKEQQRWDATRGEPQHELRLTGNAGVGYAVDWNTARDATLICGSEGRVCVWRIGALSKDDGKDINAHCVFHVPAATRESNETIVNDCRFSFADGNVFMAVTEGGRALLGDLRAAPSELVVLDTTSWGVPGSLNTIAPSPLNAHAVACGDGEGTVRVFDLRQPSSVTYKGEMHAPGTYVSQLQWCPHSSRLLLSGGEDGMCCIIDTCGAAVGSAASLRFKHAGHTEVIYDANWCWQEQYAGLVVTADPNAIIAWKPRNKFW